MKTVYHSHITVLVGDDQMVALEKISRAHKSKITTIVLENDMRELKDVMVTTYDNDYDSLFERCKKIVTDLKDVGISTARTKIEQLLKDRPEVYIPCLYMEYHVKVQDDVNKVLDYPGFVRSRNPKENKTRFFNARIYNEDDFKTVNESLNLIENVVSTHYETTLYDSNHDHDKWWA